MIVVQTSTSASPRRKSSIALLELALVHLAVGDRDARRRARARGCARRSRRSSRRGCAGRTTWPPRSSSRSIACLHELLVVLADVGVDRAAALGRRLDHGDVAQAGERHLQRARDRRRRQRQHVDAQPQLAQQLLLLDAEALLLVDDHAGRGPSGARRARAAGGCRSGCRPCPRRSPRSPSRCLLRRAEARHQLDP